MATTSPNSMVGERFNIYSITALVEFEKKDMYIFQGLTPRQCAHLYSSLSLIPGHPDDAIVHSLTKSIDRAVARYRSKPLHGPFTNNCPICNGIKMVPSSVLEKDESPKEDSFAVLLCGHRVHDSCLYPHYYDEGSSDLYERNGPKAIDRCPICQTSTTYLADEQPVLDTTEIVHFLLAYLRKHAPWSVIP